MKQFRYSISDKSVYIQPSGALPFTLIFPEEYCKHIAERDKVFFGDEPNNIPHPGSLSSSKPETEKSLMQGTPGSDM